MQRENWRDLMVAARVVAWLCIAGAVWLIATGSFLRAGAAIMVALGLHGVQRIARDHMLGWFTDAKRERQKVAFETADSRFYNQQTREARLIEAATLARERRKIIARFASLLALLMAFVFYLSSLPTKNDLGGIEIAGFLLLLVASGFAIVLVWFLGWEALYHLGYQNMPGAKVLDPPVYSPGLAEVKSQKAYGDARFATENEAMQILGAQPKADP